MIKTCVFKVKYFFCFILFVIFCSYFSEGFDSYASLFCFFSISGTAPVITFYDLQFKNIFKKFKSSFMYFSFGTGSLIVKKQYTDKEGCVLILDVSINHSEYILINLYNANIENEQTNVLSSLFELLEEFDISPAKQLVMVGDFNLFFNSKLEAHGGNPTLKKKSLAKLIEFKEAYDLFHIWRVGNRKSKRFTFTQKHSSDFIQRRLDYTLISNTLQ